MPLRRPLARKLPLAPLLASAPRVKHLQSGNGADCVQLLRAGASFAVGIDFSHVAVTAATARARRIGSPARYVTGAIPVTPLADGVANLVYTGKGALRLPAAEEDAPWGVTVIKLRRKPGFPPWRRDGAGVYGPMFLWLGHREATDPAVCVKLAGSYEEAVHVSHAVPTTISGLGQWGWLTVPLAGIDLALVRDWVEESYRNVAPRRLVAGLDARRR